MFTWLLAFPVLLPCGSLGLKFLNLTVPGAVLLGDSVWLHCDYDLEGDDLYSVKWYKNNVEFYRYLPKDRPPGQQYTLHGVYIDLSQSNRSHVILSKTDLNSEGTYGCEVSTEAPSFKTLKAEEEMRVYVFPDSKPFIEGLEPRYEVGDMVNITCSTGPSKPAAQVRWFVNGNEVSIDHDTRSSPQRHAGGLMSTTGRLTFRVSQLNIMQGVMRIQCFAIIPQIYGTSSEEIVVGERISGPGPQNVPHLVPSQRRPNITGVQKRYEVGETLDINCTSSKADRAAILKWLVNDHEVPAEQTVEYPSIFYPDGQVSSILGLRFKVLLRHLRTDELRVKCSATLSRDVHMRSEEVVYGDQHERSGMHVSDNGSGSRFWGCTAFCWWLLARVLVSCTL